MNMNRLPDYLAHMQQAAADACGFVVGMTRDEFEVDKKTQQAVIMSLIILGEAATKVMDGYSDDFAAANSESYARDAQSHRPWLFRHQYRCGL